MNPSTGRSPLMAAVAGGHRGLLTNLLQVLPGETLLSSHQTLVGEGDVPEAVSTAHRVQDLGALDGLTLGGCVI